MRCSYKDTLKNDAYLNVVMRKSLGKMDADGNYEFEVEASNENLDLQGQKVLQSALLESKDNFLKHGVISCDHLHIRHDDEGNVISDPGMVIGEPTDVYTDGKSTIVKGKLYGNNETARKFINLLKAHSTRVSASVGGARAEVTRDQNTGVEKIRHVIWNDLALTVSPVNGTVGSAKFAKALNSAQFAKSLMAGYGTDSAKFTGGRALIPESVGGVMTLDPNVLRDLKLVIDNGQVQNIKAVMAFLMSQGMSKNDALDYVRYAVKQGRKMRENRGGKKVKKSLSERISELKKSLLGENPDKGCKKSKPTKDDKSNSETKSPDGDAGISDDDDLDFGELEDEEDEKVKKAAAAVKKSIAEGASAESIVKMVRKSLAGDDDGGEDIDGILMKSLLGGIDGENSGGENGDNDAWDNIANSIGADGVTNADNVLKSLVEERTKTKQMLAAQNKHLIEIEKSMLDMTEILTAIGDQKLGARSVMNKSMNGEEPDGRPTQFDFDKATLAMNKAFKDGRIDMMKSELIMSDMQKSMATGAPMNAAYYDTLCKEVKRYEKEAE